MKKYLMIASFVGALLLQACANPGINQQQAVPAWAAHVSYDGKWLDINSLREWEDASAGLQISAEITSKAIMARVIKYRVLWFTDDGKPIKTVLGKWNDRTILAGQTIIITEQSPGPRAKDFKLEILD
jgi:uncharacterized protein YcfL